MKSVLFFLFLSFLFSCAPKEVYYPEVYSNLLQRGLKNYTVKGKVFLKGELPFMDNSVKKGGSYGDFYLNEERLLLIITPPLTGEIYLLWIKEKDELKIINPSKGKTYILANKDFIVKDLPYYFLGLKEERKSFRKGWIYGEYRFDRRELQGELVTNLLSLIWKIKELTFIENKFPEINDEGYKVKFLTLPF